MKYLSKIALSIIFSVTLFSCDQGSESIEQNEVLILKFENSNNNKSIENKKTYTIYEIIVDRDSPLEIENNALELKKITNIETGKVNFLILEKTEKTETKSNNFMDVTTRRGFQHDGGNCWIAGTWWEDDVTGASFFIPASPTAQAISNVCGWPYDEIA
jgi:hypothetical protein